MKHKMHETKIGGRYRSLSHRYDILNLFLRNTKKRFKNDRFHQIIRKIKVIFKQRWTVMKYQSLVKIQRQNSCMRWQSLIVDKYANLRYGIRNSHMQRPTAKLAIIELPRWGPGERSTRVDSPGPGCDRRESSRHEWLGGSPKPDY